MSEFDSASIPVNPVEFESFEATLQHIVNLARSAIANCSMAGMTLLDQTGPRTAVATDEVAGQVDRFQYEAQSGPCLDAYRHQEVQRIPATRTDEQWPVFSRNAAANGVLSTLSEPLIVNGDGIGALNLYGDREAAFDASDEHVAQIFASHASITLANARGYWRNEELRKNLEAALETRGVIERAKGILMVRDGLSSEEAMEALRRSSQRANRKVHEIAQEVVDSIGPQPA